MPARTAKVVFNLAPSLEMDQRANVVSSTVVQPTLTPRKTQKEKSISPMKKVKSKVMMAQKSLLLKRPPVLIPEMKPCQLIKGTLKEQQLTEQLGGPPPPVPLNLYISNKP